MSRSLDVDVGGLSDRPLTALRLLLVADVLRRAAEERSAAVRVVVVGDGRIATSTAARSLAIAPPAESVPSWYAAPRSPDAAPGIVVVPARIGTTAQHVPSAVRTIRVGDVVTRGRADAVLLDVDTLLCDREPIAVRLALLRARAGDPLILSHARLNRAEETLHRWRVKMDGWHDLPVADPPGGIAAVEQALADDLATDVALTYLHRLEVIPDLPSGAKYAAFTRLDTALGLDLRHLVGKVHR